MSDDDSEARKGRLHFDLPIFLKHGDVQYALSVTGMKIDSHYHTQEMV